MATLATPPPAASVEATPTVPNAPAATPNAPQAPAQPLTEHFPEDRIANRLRSAATKAATPPPEQPVASVPTPSPEPVPVVEEPTVDAQASTAPAEVNLEDINFDEPPAAQELPQDGVSTEATTPAPEIESTLTSMLAKGEIPDEIEKVFLRHPRGRQMLTSFKTMRDVAKPQSEGGIGRVPTVEEIRSSDASHRELQAIRYEIDNDPVSFVNNLVVPNPESGATFLGPPERAAQILGAIPRTLFEGVDRTGDPAYSHMIEAISAPVFSRFFDYQYQVALAMPENSQQAIEDKARVLDGLQIAEFKAFGQARPLNLRQQGAQNQAPQVDPEKAALQQRLRLMEQQQNQSRQQNLQRIAAEVDSKSRDEAMKDINTVFATTGIAKVYSEALLGPHRGDIFEQVKSVLPNHDPSGWQNYQFQLRQAMNGQIASDVPAKTFRQLFQNALRGSATVKERLNALVQGAKQHSDAQHADRQATQLRTEPNGPGMAARGSVLPSPQLTRQPGESQEDFVLRRLRTASQKVPLK